MQVTPVRVPMEPLVRADERAAAIDASAPPAAVTAIAKGSASAEARGDGARDRASDDSHDLRARDMEVRMEHALRENDGTLDLLPSYQYALGPDGLPYAVDPYARPEATEEPPADEVPVEEPESSEHAIAVRDRAAIEGSEPPPEKPPKLDEHVARSYARFEDAEEPAPKLDTIA
jgi:hypothetical protein